MAIFGKKFSLARAEKYWREQHIKRGAPFSNSSTINRVFKAPADLHDSATKHVERTGALKNHSHLDSILQRVRQHQPRR